MPDIDLFECRLIRPDGTVVFEMTGSVNDKFAWSPPLEYDIQGLIISQYRYLLADQPPGEWVTTAEYPEGYPGPSRIPGDTGA